MKHLDNLGPLANDDSLLGEQVTLWLGFGDGDVGESGDLIGTHFVTENAFLMPEIFSPWSAEKWATEFF
jgi:hypothetical protein